MLIGLSGIRLSLFNLGNYVSAKPAVCSSLSYLLADGKLFLADFWYPVHYGLQGSSFGTYLKCEFSISRLLSFGKDLEISFCCSLEDMILSNISTGLLELMSVLFGIPYVIDNILLI